MSGENSRGFTVSDRPPSVNAESSSGNNENSSISTTSTASASPLSQSLLGEDASLLTAIPAGTLDSDSTSNKRTKPKPTRQGRLSLRDQQLTMLSTPTLSPLSEVTTATSSHITAMSLPVSRSSSERPTSIEQNPSSSSENKSHHPSLSLANAKDILSVLSSHNDAMQFWGTL